MLQSVCLLVTQLTLTFPGRVPQLGSCSFITCCGMSSQVLQFRFGRSLVSSRLVLSWGPAHASPVPPVSYSSVYLDLDQVVMTSE